jgi:hypothetical protein
MLTSLFGSVHFTSLKGVANLNSGGLWKSVAANKSGKPCSTLRFTLSKARNHILFRTNVFFNTFIVWDNIVVSKQSHSHRTIIDAIRVPQLQCLRQHLFE